MGPFPERFGGPSTHRYDVTSPLEYPPNSTPQTKYGVQEEIEGQNLSATSICFSGGPPTEVGDNLAANRGEEVIVHDMNDFNRRMISSIRVTKEVTLKTNIWENKRKRERASAAKAIDKDNQKKI